MRHLTVKQITQFWRHPERWIAARVTMQNGRYVRRPQARVRECRHDRADLARLGATGTG